MSRLICLTHAHKQNECLCPPLNSYVESLTLREMAFGGGLFGGVIRRDVMRIRLSDVCIRQPACSLCARAWRRAHVSKQTWMLPEDTRRGLGNSSCQ